MVLRIQGKHDRGMAMQVGDQTTYYDVPAKVSVSGNVPLSALAKGRQVRISARMNSLLQAEQALREVLLVSAGDSTPGVTNESAEALPTAASSREMSERQSTTVLPTRCGNSTVGRSGLPSNWTILVSCAL